MKFSKFFSNLQEAPWYRSFLNPVIKQVSINSKLLDIGTGSGKLVQILNIEKGVTCVGVDTNQDMLNEAEIKLKETNVSIQKIEANKKLPFNTNSYNYVTICSVLFHLKKEDINLLMKDTQRILKNDGKIIVLTPTGNGNILKLITHYFSLKNFSILIWFNATKKRAKLWNNNNYLKQYSVENNLMYTSHVVMNGFAQLEIITE